MKKLLMILSFIFLIACFGVLSFKDGEIINPKVEESIAKARPPEIQTNDLGDDIITLQYDTYVKNYFTGLTQNLGENVMGSCGYVSIGMLLSYYDSFLDDNIIPEQYDAPSTGNNTDIISRRNSPGAIRESDEYIQIFKLLDEKSIQEAYYIQRYYNKMEQISDNNLHAKLLTIGKKENLIGTSGFAFGTTFSDRVKILEAYLAEMNITGYKISTPSNSSMGLKQFVETNVKAGIPVLVGAENSNNKDDSHAFIVYDWEWDPSSNKDIYYGNMGWTSNPLYSHYQFSAMYDKYTDAIALTFPEKEHIHSYNYEVQHGDHVDSYCYCNNNLRTYKSSIDSFDKMPCFDGTVTIPSWATALSDGVFKDQSEITNIVFEPGSKLETIGAHAFDNAGYDVNRIGYGIVDKPGYDFIIPSSVTKIGDYAFNDFALLSIEFESGSLLETIGDYAFSECKYLRTITIPKNVKSLGNYAFNFCQHLVEVSFESGSKLKEIKSHAFYFAGLTHFEVPAGVTTLGDNVFVGISVIRTITIPSSVEYMGKNAACYSYFGYAEKQVTIYTECLYKKDGWDDAWNGTEPNPVFWGCTLDNNGRVEMIATDFVRLTDKKALSQVNAPYKEGFLFFSGWGSDPNSSHVSYNVKTIRDGVSGPLYCKWSNTPNFNNPIPAP